MQKENPQVLLYVSKNNELAIKVPDNSELARQIQEYLQEKCGLRASIYKDNTDTVYVPRIKTGTGYDGCIFFLRGEQYKDFKEMETYQSFVRLFPSLEMKNVPSRIFPEYELLRIPSIEDLKEKENIKCDINMGVLKRQSSSLNFNNINQEKKHNFTEKNPTQENNQNIILEKEQSKVESCGGCITM